MDEEKEWVDVNTCRYELRESIVTEDFLLKIFSL